MGEVAKWGILIAGIATLVALLGGVLIFSPAEAGFNIADSITELLKIINPYVNSARGLVNYFVLPSAVDLVSFWVYMSIVGWVGIGFVKLTQSAYMWIFK